MFSPAGVASMVSTIAGQFESVAEMITDVLGAKPQVAAQVQAGIDGLKTTSAALAAAEAGGGGQALVQRIAADANAVLGAFSELPLPPFAGIALRISQILVPTVMGVASIIWPPMPVPSTAPASGSS